MFESKKLTDLAPVQCDQDPVAALIHRRGRKPGRGADLIGRDGRNSAGAQDKLRHERAGCDPFGRAFR